jgi:hypothetical protein
MAGGAVLGQLFEMKYISLNLSQELWHKTHIAKTIIRTLLTIIIYGVILIPYKTIVADQVEVSILQIFANKYCLPLFLGSFFIFGLSRTTFYHLRLVNESAVGREFVEDADSIGTKQGSGSLEFIEMEMAQQKA